MQGGAKVKMGFEVVDPLPQADFHVDTRRRVSTTLYLVRHLLVGNLRRQLFYNACRKNQLVLLKICELL